MAASEELLLQSIGKHLDEVATDVGESSSVSLCVSEEEAGKMSDGDDDLKTSCERNRTMQLNEGQPQSRSLDLIDESSTFKSQDTCTFTECSRLSNENVESSLASGQNDDSLTFSSQNDESLTFSNQNDDSLTFSNQNDEFFTFSSQSQEPLMHNGQSVESSTVMAFNNQNDKSLSLENKINESPTFNSQNDECLTPSSQDVQPSTSKNQQDKPSTSRNQKQFHIETHLIPKASVEEQNSELMGLGLQVYNQEDLEQGIIAQVDQALAKEEEERIKKLMEKQMVSVQDDLRSTREELERVGKIIRTITSSKQAETNREAKKQLDAAKRQRENKLNQMKKLKAKKKALLCKLDGKDADSELVASDDDLQFFDQALSKEGNKETEEERLIKLGEMTPFGTFMKTAENKKTKNTNEEKKLVAPKPPVVSDFEMFLQGKDTTYSSKKGKALKRKSQLAFKSSHSKPHLDNEDNVVNSQPCQTLSKKNKPNWFDEHDKKVYRTERDFSGCTVRRKLPRLEHNFSGDPELSGNEDDSEDERSPSEEEYLPDTDHLDDEEWEGLPPPRKKKKTLAKKGKSIEYSGSGEDENEVESKKGKCKPAEDNYLKRTRDDGNLSYYQKRLKAYQKTEAARKKKQREEGLSDSEDEETEFEGGFKVPGKLWKKLFGYQRTGVKWLWELHCQQSGGIIGDEMGLGKTIQTIAFLASLRSSKIKQRPFRYVGLGPTVIVCPATVLHQWVREFHKWWPDIRVAILHSSGSFTGTEDALIHNIVNQHGVLITSYTSLVQKQDALLHHDWHYIILDEGHKIRNPDAQATLACKQFRTPHRIILSGSPIQNNLKELWSLFDFIFPGKLGTLPDFMTHFSVPIVQGGYSNASQVQVQTAYKCACILRDTISPYLLRRMKADVKSAIKLPGKSEQVLFCRLTDEQRDVYQEYLDSKECHAILGGKYKVFAGLITLRKICNHPDISTGGPRVLVGQSTDGDESLEYGYWRRSGKLIVVESLLKLWKKQGQRVLLFSQSKQMLDILEVFVRDRAYSYLRMDGGTSISARQPLINKYNSNLNIFVFLLTTRVGGLGVNLTGANRVVIFDPDWNPSTDTQARERAWRIGQNKQVTIYRLLTTGTIEEKIYHRQIFKQFLTNRVLKDPKQRRFFKTNDLYELFTLGTNDNQQGTETSALFAGTGSEVSVGQRVNRFDALKAEAIPVRKKDSKLKVNSGDKNTPTDDKTDKLRELARKLSKQIGEKATTTTSSNGFAAESDSSKQTPDNDTSGHRKKKKKKSKRHKDAEFEGEKIPHLTKLRDYMPSKKTDDTAENLSAHQDDYVLKKLFKKTGIQGALKHDVIVEASKTDYALVEGEAEKVAREAASALKRSRRQCMNALSGIPNWTGQRGAGTTNSRPRFGRKKNSLIADKTVKPSSPVVKAEKKVTPDAAKVFDGSLAGTHKSTGLFTTSKQNVMSSEELLERMRTRNISGSQEAGEDDDLLQTPATSHTEDIELITDIRNFIAFQCHMDGQASTQELLDEFGVKLPPGDSAKFKAMLRQICDFDLTSDVGIWQLKSAYR